jgi:hypothetical protein
LTWQTARIQGATVEELLQAPVLFLSGTKPLEFSAKEKELLRDYILQGGFIFAEAAAGNGCGDPKPFEDSFKKLCHELLDGKLERLPPEHPLWSAEVEVDPRHLPKEFIPFGVQACCRTSMVYSPIAISCRWELYQPDRKSPYSEKVTQELTACVGFGRNVLAYATGRQLRDKLEKPLVAKSGAAGGDAPRGTIVIPRLEVGAGGELAPRALPNLMEWMRTSTPLRVKTEKEAISLTNTNLQNYAIVFVHGRDRVLFSQTQRNALKEYFTISDGTLIANSICGAKAFTDSFRNELKLAIPEMVFEEKLPESHPLFTKAYHGFDIRRVKLRKPLGDGTKVSFTAETTFPVIEVGRIGNRIAVIFSPYDLSCALENQYSPQCAGYTIDDAARIGINMILYALQQ